MWEVSPPSSCWSTYRHGWLLESVAWAFCVATQWTIYIVIIIWYERQGISITFMIKVHCVGKRYPGTLITPLRIATSVQYIVVSDWPVLKLSCDIVGMVAYSTIYLSLLEHMIKLSHRQASWHVPANTHHHPLLFHCFAHLFTPDQTCIHYPELILL